MTTLHSELVLIPLGNRALGLTREEFAAALERGRDFTTPQQTHVDRGDSESLLTAEELQAKTGVPASWYLEQARTGAIPHVRLGKYRRFLLTEVVESGRYVQRSK